MEKLSVNLRQGTAEPIQAEVSGHLLARVRGLEVSRAIEQILQSLPEEKRPYGRMMLETMQANDSVTEIVNIKDEEVVAIDRRNQETFDSVLAKLASRQNGHADALAEIEIGVAHLEKGGVTSAHSLSAESQTAPPHDFFRAALQSPLIVVDRLVYRPKHNPDAGKPYFVFCGERFTLSLEQSLDEYDDAYYEDHSEEFNRDIHRRAAIAASGQIVRNIERPVFKTHELAEFVALHLAPRLRSFHEGREASIRHRMLANNSLAVLSLEQGVFRSPQPSPLCETLPSNCLALAPHVYLLQPRGSFLWRALPDPGVYFPQATYGVGNSTSLSQIENKYAQIRDIKLRQEALRRSQRYADTWLERREREEQLVGCRQTLERSRSQFPEINYYEDPYHTVTARRGVFILYRNFPSAILRAGGGWFPCEATRLSINLTQPFSVGVFHHGCVYADRGFRHPLVDSSNVVLMDRCDNDIDALRYSGDLCGALIKHLNDAKLMLEIGYEKARHPSRALKPISEREAVRSGLPIYRYRYAVN